jgi:hypothetical protein
MKIVVNRFRLSAMRQKIKAKDGILSVQRECSHVENEFEPLKDKLELFSYQQNQICREQLSLSIVL